MHIKLLIFLTILHCALGNKSFKKKVVQQTQKLHFYLKAKKATKHINKRVHTMAQKLRFHKSSCNLHGNSLGANCTHDQLQPMHERAELHPVNSQLALLRARRRTVSWYQYRFEFKILLKILNWSNLFRKCDCATCKTFCSCFE